MAEPISSTRNPAVAGAARLHRARQRKETGRTLIEGPSVVSEAIAAGVALVELFVLEGDPIPAGASSGVRVVTEPVLERVAGTANPRGPVAVIEIPAPVIDHVRPAIVAWEVGDPGNVGTLIRTAAAFGYGFVAGPGTADPWSPKVLRAAAGGHFRTSIGHAADLEALDGFVLVGTVVSGGSAPGPIRGGEALVVGSEAHGLPEVMVAACERLITIPMVGETESLNAAVAGGIAAYLGTLRESH